jgi:hypothetical protein
MQRWKHRPDGANWGEFGPDDELGRANLIQEAQVLKGAREIRTGKMFCPFVAAGPARRQGAEPTAPSAAAQPYQAR